MTGCRHGAKNTLVKNYLYLAELAGATIHPERTVTAVRPHPGGGYRVDTSRTGAWRRRIDDRAFTADHVVISAGTWGTQQLLHRMKADGVLPHLSDRLGLLSRTNSESIGSVTAKWRHRNDYDFTKGAALSTSFRPDEHTLVEPFHYGRCLNMVGLRDDPGDSGRRSSSSAAVARHGGPTSRSTAVALRRHQPVVTAQHHHGGHAGPGQLDHPPSQAHRARAVEGDVQAR